MPDGESGELLDSNQRQQIEEIYVLPTAPSNHYSKLAY